MTICTSFGAGCGDQAFEAFEAAYDPHSRLPEHGHASPFFTYVLRGSYCERAGSRTAVPSRLSRVGRFALNTLKDADLAIRVFEAIAQLKKADRPRAVVTHGFTGERQNETARAAAKVVVGYKQNARLHSAAARALPRISACVFFVMGAA